MISNLRIFLVGDLERPIAAQALAPGFVRRDDGAGTRRILVALNDAGGGGPKAEVRRQRTAGSDDIGGPVCRTFQRIAGLPDREACRRKFAGLLNDVGEFMTKQPPALWRFRAVAPLAKDDVRSGRPGPGAQAARRAGRQVVGVQTDAAEVATEAFLHPGANGRIDWRTRRAQHLLNGLLEAKSFLLLYGSRCRLSTCRSAFGVRPLCRFDQSRCRRIQRRGLGLLSHDLSPLCGSANRWSARTLERSDALRIGGIPHFAIASSPFCRAQVLLRGRLKGRVV